MKQDNQQKIKYQGVYDWMQSVVTMFLAFMIALTFFGGTMGVSQVSMMPTLHDGDRMILRSFLYTPAHGDIIVFSTQSFRDGEALVKRVIAIEGDTIDIDFGTGVVYLNGVALEEDYVIGPTTLRGDVSFPQTVPQGHVFVIGDNRTNSQDSRNSNIGHIDTREIIGQVVAIMAPFNRMQLFLR